MRFVHAADLHLDSPLRGLDLQEGMPAERIRLATREALKNLVTLCVEEEAAFLLLAGDLYDGDWKDYTTGLFFAGEMSRLREAGVRVFLIRGNHDAASVISKELPLPPNVRELATKAPETVRDEELGIAVHGQGFARRAVTEDLAASYPDAISGYLNIGLLHTCLDGREGHDPYAPTGIDLLTSKGYDYWALGHVHRREVIRREPWIVFPGNLQGRHARETGPKGATLVTVEDGRITEAVHRPLDVVRWSGVEVEASDLRTPDEVLEAVRLGLEDAMDDAEGRLVVARVSVIGATRAHDRLQREAEQHIAAIRALAYDLGDVCVEKVRLRTRPNLELEDIVSRDDAFGQLARELHARRSPDADLTDLMGLFDDLKRKLPREAREGEDGVRLDDPVYLREALEDVERLLLPQLLTPGDLE